MTEPSVPQTSSTGDFSAPAPNRLWLCDITYVKTHSGVVYVAFVIDCFARLVVGFDLTP